MDILPGYVTAVQQPVVEDMDELVIGHGLPVPMVGEGSKLAPIVDGGSMLVPIVDGRGVIVVGRVRLGAGTMTDGLTPKLLISKEPNGIPAGEVPPGADGDIGATVDTTPLLEVVPHVAEPPDEGAPIPIPPPS
jgi:hypothetical protein